MTVQCLFAVEYWLEGDPAGRRGSALPGFMSKPASLPPPTEG